MGTNKPVKGNKLWFFWLTFPKQKRIALLSFNKAKFMKISAEHRCPEWQLLTLKTSLELPVFAVFSNIYRQDLVILHMESHWNDCVTLWPWECGIVCYCQHVLVTWHLWSLSSSQPSFWALIPLCIGTLIRVTKTWDDRSGADNVSAQFTWCGDWLWKCE